MAHAHTSSQGPGWFGRWMDQMLQGWAPGKAGSRTDAARSTISPSSLSEIHSHPPPPPAAQAPDAFRQRQVRHAVRSALARIGLGAPVCEVAIKPGRPLQVEGRAPIATYFVLVRLNQWQPEILLKSKAIETLIQGAGKRLEGVRVTHVFWRFGSDVTTPYDDASRHGKVSGKGMAATHTMAVDMTAETVPAALAETDVRDDVGSPAIEAAEASATTDDDPYARTTWSSLHAVDSSPPRVWAETQPCDLDSMPAPKSKKQEAVGFVHL